MHMLKELNQLTISKIYPLLLLEIKIIKSWEMMNLAVTYRENH